MLKGLLIIGLVVYGLYKFGSLFYKAGAASRQVQNPPPPAPNPKVKKGSNFKGGEYVDYEEVK
jgi:hypothetical protein